MFRRTAGAEGGRQPAPSASSRKPLFARGVLLALGAAYVGASLGGWRPDGTIAVLAYAPPIVGFLFLAAFFASTLRRGAEPLIARVARREHPHLAQGLAAYTRALTVLWTFAFVGLAIASAALTAAIPFSAWSRWIHALGLAVPAALFFGERLYRLRRFPAHAHATAARQLLNIVRVMREAAMGGRPGKLPLLQCRSMSEPFLLDHRHTVLAGQYVAQVHALAAALPDGTHVINLCEGRHAFVVAFGAAMVRGRVSLLPAGHSRGDWQRLLGEYPGATVVGEQKPADAPDGWLDATPYLATEDFAADVPWIDAERIAAILFTSGSTGRSVGHPKTWSQFWRGAHAWATRLGWDDTTRLAVIGSVAPQHMFGFESTVVLPFYAGVPVHAHRPLLPGDLEAARGGQGRSYWWMTTPLHLRAALASSAQAPHLVGMVSSTMNLPPAIARRAEARWSVPVIELYGSTETGALATRRCALEEAWRPFHDVAFRPAQNGVVVEAERIGAPVHLGDLLAFEPDGRFLWRGRVADLVKVAGKRASLAALERRMQEIEGVDDATLFVPESEGAEVRRLAGFYVSSTLEPAAVLQALRGVMDAVFVPRPLFRVARLPRNANGKLTRAALVQLYESCHSPDRFMIAADHPAIAGHFPGQPIVPGALILAQVAQEISTRFPGRSTRCIANVRFHAPLVPGQPARIETQQTQARIDFMVKSDATLIATGTWKIN